MAACELSVDYRYVRELSPFSVNWVLKAKVMSKRSLTTYTRGAEVGHVFSISLQDEESMLIAASFFDEAALRYYQIIQVDQIYEFEDGEVKLEKEKYRRFDNPLHLIFGNRAKVKQLPQSTFKIRSFGLVSLNQLPSLVSSGEKFVDIVALATDIGPVVATSTYQKRTLQVVDSSGFSVLLDLWNDVAYNCLFDLPHSKPPVVLCRCVRLSNYANITLSSERDTTTVLVNPLDCAETEALQAWRDQGGYSPGMHFIPLTSASPKAKPSSTYMTVRQLGMMASTGYCVVRARVRLIKYDEANSLWYDACPVARCAKQLEQKPEGFYCGRCSQSFDAALVKYRVQLLLSDAVGDVWVLAYDEVGESLFGVSATRLKRMCESQAEQFSDVLEGVLHSELSVCVQVRVADGFRKCILTHLLDPDHRKEANLMLADLV